ncbi:hypothetical protein [Rufibacter tibetensis]|uniref:Uncharacterized protein n=1 Tax=Rufibacter tibetensis TaxID=512763 RepID=A0A0P0C1X3_9BACT|nr:hypothetical protein [Rufibacter tibetensis]ALI98926.1 hypothetical protein DC20_07970 [Rufibacter tibetensis]
MKMQEENNRDDDAEVDEYSCLFLSKYKLDRVYCPFMVISKVDIHYFKPGDKVLVTRVTFSHEKVILYQVFGKLYPHFYFDYTQPTNLVLTRLK